MARANDTYEHHREQIKAVASQYPVSNIRVFGSVLHRSDVETSDIDLLVDPHEGATLFDLGGLQDELQQLLGVQVDLLTPGDLPARFRASIISEARPV